MTMRRLLNIAMPFMRQSGEVVNRGPVVGTPRESNPDCVPGKTPKAAEQAGHEKVLYGLPCTRCGVYYAAGLAVCPVCNSKERVIPKLKSPAWPASVPQSRAGEALLEENLGGLATINRALLANLVQPLTMLTTTQAIPVPA